MSERDYSKQLERRQKIGERTLVVGVDIGCKFNAVALMNKEGQVLGAYPKSYNSRKGFDYFVEVVEEAKTKHNLNEVLIGMEPTGHYWRKLAFFAMERGYAVRFVRTTALKHAREINESSSSKSDVKDALTITNITREGKTIDTVIEDGIYRELRTLAKVREKVLKHSISSQATLGSILDDYFPELKDLFCSMKTRSLWAILERCPFPEDVLKMRVSTITNIIAKSSRRGSTAAEKAKKLQQAAREGIGLQRVGVADRYRLKMCLAEVQRTEMMLKEIKKEMKKLLAQIPCAEYILSIPGVGPITTSVFLGELGNPEYFNHPKQIIKYAGYDPQEKDSGKRIGRKFISKKGRWLLRKHLFYMAMKVVQDTSFFKDYYKRKLEKKNRFGQLLQKKEALCAVIIKLIKVIFALLRDKRRFSDTEANLAMAA